MNEALPEVFVNPVTLLQGSSLSHHITSGLDARKLATIACRPANAPCEGSRLDWSCGS